MDREEACDWYPTPNLRMCLGILQQQWRRVLVDYRHYNGASRPMRCQSAETEWRDIRQATAEEVAEIKDRVAQETGLECTCGVGAPDRMPHDMKCPQREPLEPWRCTICSLLNPDDATYCRQCEYSRMVMRDGKQVPRDRQR